MPIFYLVAMRDTETTTTSFSIRKHNMSEQDTVALCI